CMQTRFPQTAVPGAPFLGTLDAARLAPARRADPATPQEESMTRSRLSKWLLAPVVALAAALAVTGTHAAEIDLPKTIAWSAYGVGSGGYNQAVAIGNVFKNKYGISLRVLPGKNDVSRNIVLKNGQVQFSANGVGGTYMAQEGLYDFGAPDWGPQPVRALLLNSGDAVLTVITAKDANIKTLADLKGKRVARVGGAPAPHQNITALRAFARHTFE